MRYGPDMSTDLLCIFHCHWSAEPDRRGWRITGWSMVPLEEKTLVPDERVVVTVSTDNASVLCAIKRDNRPYRSPPPSLHDGQSRSLRDTRCTH
jgi:hypothetical protein